jgi:ankyrin repeat protein
MPPRELAALPTAARDNDLDAARTMLDVGWPIDVLGPERATALHWAAFHGNAAMVRRLLDAAPQLDLKEATHGGTALSWAIYGSQHGWYRESGDYASVVTALLDAGATAPADAATVDASDAVKAALRQR